MKKRLFSEKQVDLSAVLGGPIPPGFLIYRNYKALGKNKHADIALASTLVFTVTFFYLLFKLPQEVVDKIPSFAFTAFYGLLVFIFFRRFMAKDVEQAIDSGAEKGSNWSVAGLTILGFVINLTIIFALAFDQPFYEGEEVKSKGNSLYYDQSVPIANVNKLASTLEDMDFFGPEYGNIARLQLINDEYQITMVIDENLWDDGGIIAGLTSMKGLMEVEFGKKTKLKLESVSVSGGSKYKEL